MKKYFTVYILLISLILVIFSSCKTDTKNNENVKSETNSVSSLNSNTESSEKPSKTILGEKTETDNLYKLSSDSFQNQNEEVRISCTDNYACIEFISPGMDSFSENVTLFSIAENKVLNTISLENDIWYTGITENGGFYAFSLNNKKIYFYNNQGQIISSSNLELDNINYTDFLQVSPDCKYLIYSDPSTKNIILYSFENEEITVFYENIYSECQWTEVKYDNGFVIGNMNGVIIKIDPVTKQCTKTEINENIDYFSSCYGFEKSDTSMIITPIKEDSESYLIICDENEEYISAGKSYLSTKITDYNNDGFTLNFYNLQDYTVLPALKFESALKAVSFTDDDYALIITDSIDKNSYDFYIYDLESCTPLKNLTLSLPTVSEEVIPEWTGTQEMISLAEEILKENNIRIVYDYKFINLSDMGYSFTPSSEKEIYEKMLLIKDFLEFFPDGMTQEIGRGKEIWLMLCKKLTNEVSSVSPEGLAYTYQGHLFIAIESDGTDNYFCENLAHEFSHLIDNSLSYKCLDEWVDFLPEEVKMDGYTESYDNYNNNEYTPYDEDKSNIWFYNQYSRVSPTEDRAVIFEKMYISYKENKLAENFVYENLKNKAKLYCEMLRESFNSCKDAEALNWEKPFV